MNQRFNGKVTFNYTAKISEMLNKYLLEGAIKKFRKTIFGHILDAGVVHGQPQVVHGIMLREIESMEGDMMEFYIGGKVLKFGLVEFGVLSGLRMSDNMNMSIFDHSDYRLKDMYFKEDLGSKNIIC